MSLTQIQLSEDEIIRRKLLMDGDGMGDDRRLNMFMKTFYKWCTMKDEPQEERVNVYEKMLLILAQCEFSMSKSQQVILMNQKEMQNYEELYHKIEAGIADAQKKIVDCKSELLMAKRIRKNKQEYDALARVIEKQPDRKGTLSKLQQLKQEILALQKTKEDLDRKLEKRKKQFQVLLGAVYELSQIMQDDESDSDGEIQIMDTA